MLPVRFAEREAFVVSGLARTYTQATMAAIPQQWHAAAPDLVRLAGDSGTVTYGVVYNLDNPDGTMDYLCGLELAPDVPLPPGWGTVRLDAARYAVFTYTGPIAGIGGAWETILNGGLGEAGVEHSGGPQFERYDERYDAQRGDGAMEIWIPVR